MMRVSRTNRSLVADWWWTVDRWMLVAIVMLVLVGAVLSLAASPAVADRLGLPSFHFVYRHAVFVPLAMATLLGVSLLTPKQVRRLAVLLLGFGFALMVMTLFGGAEINGARRWLSFAGLNVQPSEFVKPAFVVVAAWMFAEGARTPRFPGAIIAFGLYAAVAAVLALQPDFGQVMLVTLVFSALLFWAGLSWAWIGTLGVVAIAGAFAAYALMPHVTSRVDRFIDPASGDTYQTDRALEAFQTGGFFGLGPGEGQVKRVLPDAHTDFIFAVAAEEFGVLVALVIVCLFGFVVLRTLARAVDEPDRFVQLAASGLVVLFGLQALINMAVNVNLMPAKGMTLPFVSYGGSSMLAISISMGMLLALTRRRSRGAAAADRARRAYA